ncbi:C56D1 protein, partial [Amia calva]|nr:C56D1 protein [Amia calva]
MRGDVQYSPVGEGLGLGLGLREFWLYGWLRTAAVVAAHVVALGFTIVITLLSRPGTSLFSWHPTCMSFAFCLCVTEGVLLLSAEGSPLCLRSRQGRVRVHWLYHATCGLLAYLLATGTVLLGMFSDWFQGIIKGVVWYAFLPLPLFPALVVMNQITSAYLPKRKITT